MPACPTLFTPLQAHPRELLRAGVAANVSWMREHAISIQQMVEQHKFAVVVAGADLRYEAPRSFLDGETIDVESAAVVHPRGRLVRGDTRFSSGTRRFASLHTYFRPVQIGEHLSATARSSVLPPHLCALFHAHEVDSGAYGRPTKILARTLPRDGQLLARGQHGFRLHRYAMDFADQWAFMEAFAFVSASREGLAFTASGRVPALRDALAAPVRQVCMDLSRPLYLMDEAIVDSSAYLWEGGLYFLHRILGQERRDDPVHAVVVEHMAHPPC